MSGKYLKNFSSLIQRPECMHCEEGGAGGKTNVEAQDKSVKDLNYVLEIMKTWLVHVLKT